MDITISFTFRENTQGKDWYCNNLYWSEEKKNELWYEWLQKDLKREFNSEGSYMKKLIRESEMLQEEEAHSGSDPLYLTHVNLDNNEQTITPGKMF